MRIIAALILGCSFAVPAEAITKCTEPGGKVTYQEGPCEGLAQATKVEMRMLVPATTEGSDSTSLTQRAREMEQDRKLREIKWDIEKLERDIGRYRSEKEAALLEIYLYPRRYTDPTLRHNTLKLFYEDRIREAESRLAELRAQEARARSAPPGK